MSMQEQIDNLHELTDIVAQNTKGAMASGLAHSLALRFMMTLFQEVMGEDAYNTAAQAHLQVAERMLSDSDGSDEFKDKVLDALRQAIEPA